MKFKTFDGKKEHIVSLTQIKNTIRRCKVTNVLTARRQGSKLIFVDLNGHIKMSIQFLGIV